MKELEYTAPQESEFVPSWEEEQYWKAHLMLETLNINNHEDERLGFIWFNEQQKTWEVGYAYDPDLQNQRIVEIRFRVGDPEERLCAYHLRC